MTPGNDNKTPAPASFRALPPPPPPPPPSTPSPSEESSPVGAVEDQYVGPKDAVVAPICQMTPASCEKPLFADDGERSIFEIDANEIQDEALSFFKEGFAKEIKKFKQTFSSGMVYSLKDNFNALPAIIQQQMMMFREDPEMAFIWTWRGDVPDLFFFRSHNQETGRQTPVVINSDTGREESLLRGASMLMLGSSLRSGISGGTNGSKPTVSENMSLNGVSGKGGPRSGLPFGRMAFSAGLGTAIFMGVHMGGMKLGVPEKLQPTFDLAGMVGAISGMDHGSRFLAQRGILTKPLFPNGVGWGRFVQAAPLFALSNIPISVALHAAGWEFGSLENTFGTVGIGMAGYSSLSQTTSLLSQAAVATPGSEFALQYPRVMAFAEQHPGITNGFARLNTAYGTVVGAGMTTGSYAGIAGGGGVLGGSLQAANAAGAVLLGSWLGGQVVDAWASASGNSTDKDTKHDYNLIDFTWGYINQESLGIIGALFDPLLRGLETFTVGNDVWETMQVLWSTWRAEINSFGDNMESVLPALALASISLDPVDDSGSQRKLKFNEDIFQGEVEKLFQDNSKAIISIYKMYRLFEGTTEGLGMKDESGGRVIEMIGSNGLISSYHRKDVREYLREKIRLIYKDGSIKPLVRNLLRDAKRQYAERLISLGLARLDSRGVPRAIKVPRDQLTPEQIEFKYGGFANYRDVVSGKITLRSEITSPEIFFKRRIDGLRRLNQLLSKPGKTTNIDEILFPIAEDDPFYKDPSKAK